MSGRPGVLPVELSTPMLNQLADQGVAIVGINYKDQDAKAQSWLEQRGNPLPV
jgi:cytochrome c biogenesis protein CcmG/thiol:disulfide interchange protein DsbE